MPESAPSHSGPFKQIVHLILAVLVVLYLAKIYLRDPEYRAVEVCYCPTKSHTSLGWTYGERWSPMTPRP